MRKKWYLSRTVWMNVAALLAAIITEAFGYDVDEKYVALFLTLMNLILRKVTKEAIEW